MAQAGKLVAAWLVMALLAPTAALAQSSEPDNSSDNGKPGDTYPVSLDRIRRGLVGTPRTKETRHGLNIQYYIEVYGHAPKLELFTTQDNLTNAPVMYGGMTHQEFLNLVTPQAFRAPTADIPGMIAALIKWYAEKQKQGGARRDR